MTIVLYKYTTKSLGSNLSEEEKNESENIEDDSTHDWNIEEITQEIAEKQPPNDKIVSYYQVPKNQEDKKE